MRNDKPEKDFEIIFRALDVKCPPERYPITPIPGCFTDEESGESFYVDLVWSGSLEHDRWPEQLEIRLREWHKSLFDDINKMIKGKSCVFHWHGTQTVYEFRRPIQFSMNGMSDSVSMRLSDWPGKDGYSFGEKLKAIASKILGRSLQNPAKN
jgi:hypothetical protein